MYMVEIFNRSKSVEILIDSTDAIQVTPIMYQEPNHLMIEFRNGFNLLQHAKSCSDCNSFISSLSTVSNDWFLIYDNRTYKINTGEIGSKEYGSNHISLINADYEYGTKLVLSLYELDIKELEELEILSAKLDYFENACVYRDLKKVVLEIQSL